MTFAQSLFIHIVYHANTVYDGGVNGGDDCTMMVSSLYHKLISTTIISNIPKIPIITIILIINLLTILIIMLLLCDRSRICCVSWLTEKDLLTPQHQNMFSIMMMMMMNQNVF